MNGFFLQIPIWLFISWFALHIRSLRRRGRRSPFNENILRLPGFTIRNLQQDFGFDAVLYMFGLIAAPYLLYSFRTGNMVLDWLLLAVGVIVTAFFLVRCLSMVKQVIKLHLGVEAETATGQELNLLMRDGAWVFHDIPYQYGNIDHVVIGPGGVFAVETKGVSKPTNNDKTGAENATVTVQGGSLVFPHSRSKEPIEQANIHAKWLHNEIQKRFGISAPVRAVVALPGWMVNGAFSDKCWVVNPKRGNALRTAVTSRLIDDSQIRTIAAWIEDLARSIPPKSKEFDPKSEFRAQGIT